jgi:F0F1-type ATP synthase membrane subunit c/vacuolar-type H+-ATPase subunit K
MNLGEILAIWVPVLLILISLSFMFGDWPGWRWVETVLVGGGMGHTFVTTWGTIISTGINPIMKGQIILLPGIIFGLLLYLRLHPDPNVKWISRYGFLWVVAVGAGLALSSLWQGNIMVALIKAIDVVGTTPADTFNKVLMFIIFITVLSYFIFTREHTGALGVSTKIGRYFLMIALGVGFAVLISMYYNVALERIWWILDALGIVEI